MVNFSAIVDSLELEIEQARNKNSVEALGLLACMNKPDFIVHLFIFHNVLSIINVLSKYFQGKEATLGQASETITSVINHFKQSRCNFKGLWTSIDEFAKKHDINLENIRNKRKQPGSISSFLAGSATGEHNSVEKQLDSNPFDYWKTSIYYPVMDNVIANLQSRFENLPLTQSIDKFMKLEFNGAEPFINHYRKVIKVDKVALQAEMTVIKNILINKNMKIKMDNLRSILQKEITPNYYKLLQVSLALPVSSAGCERSFSAMRRLQTWLRSTMVQERFSNLAILNVENNLVKSCVTPERVLEIFVERNRKLKL